MYVNPEGVNERYSYGVSVPSLSLFWLEMDKSKLLVDNSSHVEKYIDFKADKFVLPLHEEYWMEIFKDFTFVKYLTSKYPLIPLDKSKFYHFPRGRIYYNEFLKIYTLDYGYWLNPLSLDVIKKRYNISIDIDLWTMLRKHPKAIRGYYLYKDSTKDRPTFIEYMRLWIESNKDLINKLENYYSKIEPNWEKNYKLEEIINPL